MSLSYMCLMYDFLLTPVSLQCCKRMFVFISVSCFEKVSRSEAEVLLERYPDRGNLLLRPGRDGTSFAVTTRQDLNG